MGGGVTIIAIVLQEIKLEVSNKFYFVSRWYILTYKPFTLIYLYVYTFDYYYICQSETLLEIAYLAKPWENRVVKNTFQNGKTAKTISDTQECHTNYKHLASCNDLCYLALKYEYMWFNSTEYAQMGWGEGSLLLWLCCKQSS